MLLFRVSRDSGMLQTFFLPLQILSPPFPPYSGLQSDHEDFLLEFDQQKALKGNLKSGTVIPVGFPRQ